MFHLNFRPLSIAFLAGSLLFIEAAQATEFLAYSQEAAVSVEVTGAVSAFGFVAANIVVQFSAGGTRQTAITDAWGNYSIVLRPGIYAVQTLASDKGFCPTRRGSVSLKTGEPIGLDFDLVTCETDTSYKPYDEAELPEPVGSSGIRPLIAYGGRRERGAITYLGFVVQGVYIRPTVTYDHWTLRANSITYDQVEHTWRGEGNVTWQDGVTTQTGEHVEILLRVSPIIKILR